MTNESAELDYPEMPNYAWATDLERVRRESKWLKQDYNGTPITADKLPKVPINMVLSALKETLTYPEVLEVYGGGSGDADRDHHLTMWFDEYLKHKYGNNDTKIPNVFVAMAEGLEKIARGEFSGMDDPHLIEILMDQWCVGPSDNNNYGQPSAHDLI